LRLVAGLLDTDCGHFYVARVAWIALQTGERGGIVTPCRRR